MGPIPMRAVIQRVSQAAVRVEGETVGSINTGLLVLLGVHRNDSLSDVEWLASKIAGLRIFEQPGKGMNLSLTEVGGDLLVVSQFTLYGDCRRGRRPSWSRAAPPDLAQNLYREFINRVRDLGLTVETGVFGAEMEVILVNQGPVTLIIDTPR